DERRAEQYGADDERRDTEEQRKPRRAAQQVLLRRAIEVYQHRVLNERRRPEQSGTDDAHRVPDVVEPAPMREVEVERGQQWQREEAGEGEHEARTGGLADERFEDAGYPEERTGDQASGDAEAGQEGHVATVGSRGGRR